MELYNVMQINHSGLRQEFCSFLCHNTGRVIAIRIDHTEVRRNACVEDPDFFLMNERKKLLRLVFINDELYLDTRRAGLLKKSLLMQSMMPPKTANRTKRRATPNAQ